MLRPPASPAPLRVAFLLALLAAAAPHERAGASSPAPDAPPPVEITAIDLVRFPDTAPPRLRIAVVNRSGAALAAWAFEVRAAGQLVDGYRDLLVLAPVAPGDTGHIELFRLAEPPVPYDLGVRLVEAWTAERLGESPGEGEWRLLAPLDGPALEAAATSRRIDRAEPR